MRRGSAQVTSEVALCSPYQEEQCTDSVGDEFTGWCVSLVWFQRHGRSFTGQNVSSYSHSTDSIFVPMIRTRPAESRKEATVQLLEENNICPSGWRPSNDNSKVTFRTPKMSLLLWKDPDTVQSVWKSIKTSIYQLVPPIRQNWAALRTQIGPNFYWPTLANPNLLDRDISSLWHPTLIESKATDETWILCSCIYHNPIGVKGEVIVQDVREKKSRRSVLLSKQILTNLTRLWVAPIHSLWVESKNEPVDKSVKCLSNALNP